MRAPDEATVFADALRALGKLLRDEDREPTGEQSRLRW